MRRWQLEYGAEIGRAIVNFRGPIVFCVISRYHGGAFVVFSQRLNDGFEAIAVEGARASVIGGSAAAGVVFTRDVMNATRRDPRIVELDERIEARVEELAAAGAAEEARRAADFGASRTARAALGFEELLAGDVEAVARAHRAYARRQLTWLRRMEGVQTIDRSGLSDREVAGRILGMLDASR
jgi:hypothetical protein